MVVDDSNAAMSDMQLIDLLDAMAPLAVEPELDFNPVLEALRHSFDGQFAAFRYGPRDGEQRDVSVPALPASLLQAIFAAFDDHSAAGDPAAGATVAIEDVQSRADLGPLRRSLLEHDIRALVLVALRQHQNQFGSLLLAYNQPHTLAAGQTRALQSVVRQLAIVLGHRRGEQQVARRITALEEQITRRRRAEGRLQEERELLQLLQEIAANANEAQTFQEALRFAIDGICAYTKWPVGHVFWLEENHGPEMVSSGIWHCSVDGEITDFQTSTSAMRLVPGEGRLGRLMSSGGSSWQELAEDDEKLARLQFAEELGFVSSFTFPVRVADRVYAVLEFFSPSSDQPSENLIEAMDFVASQLGQVVLREQTQRALRNSEKMLAEAQRMAHLGSWEWDIPADRLTWSDELYRIYGLSRDDFTPTYEAFLQAVHPEDRERVAQIVQSAYRSQEPFEYYHRIVRGDGIVRVLYARGYTVVDHDGNTVRMYGTGQDVTNRHQTEEALRKSEKSYRTLARNIPDAIVTLYDHELNLILIEGSVPPDATTLVPGTSLRAILPDGDQIQQIQPFFDALQGANQTFERQYGDRTFLIQAVPVRDEDGQIFAGIAMAQDITERKEAERSLIMRAQQLSALHEMGQTVAASLDLEVVFKRVLETLRPLLRAEGVFVLLRESEETLVFAAANQVGVGDLTGQRVPTSRGVAGDVLRTGRLQWLQGDETVERVYHELTEVAHYHPRAIIAAPMKLHGQLIGVMEAVHSRPDAFDEEERALMETAASWVAIAIGNARQHGRLQRQFQESEALANISRALSQTLDLDRILNLIVSSARDLMSRADWSIFFYAREEAGRRRLEPAAYAGLEPPSADEQSAGTGGSVPQRFLSRALESALTAPDANADLISYDDDSGALIAVPVQGHDGSLGILSVQSSTPGGFTPDDHRLLTMLGRQAAMAVENARLFQDQQRARRTADTLRAANVALSQSLKLHTVIDTFLEYAQRLIGFDHALLLLARRHGQLHVEAARGFPQDVAAHTVATQDHSALQSILAARTATILDDERHREIGLVPPDLEPRAAAWLLIPLLSGERPMGLLALGCQESGAYQQRHATLAEGLAAQATVAIQNARLFAEVQSSQQRLRLLSRQIVGAQEEERQRISRELHDEAGQALTALKISLEMIKSGWSDAPGVVADQLAEAIDMTDQTMEQIRLLAHDLRPPVLDTFGLSTSVEGLARDFGRRTRLDINMQNEPLPKLPDAIAISCYRFVQETLTNVARHAQARKVNIELRRDSDKIMVSVTDDGIGFDVDVALQAPETRTGIGLMGMQDRFELLNGWIEIESAPGQGTTVSAYVPFEEDE